jgi:hypothetical protein
MREKNCTRAESMVLSETKEVLNRGRASPQRKRGYHTNIIYVPEINR